jgi:RNA polymerase sigma factor (sigma-70 family)
VFEPQWRHRRRWRRMKQLDSQLADPASQRWATRRNGLRVPANQTAEQATERQELLDRTREAVAQLPPGQRDLITAVYGLDGQTVSETEIAHRHGTSPQAVCNRKRRALEKLRTMLTERKDDHARN